jgi:hypothetical protein
MPGRDINMKRFDDFERTDHRVKRNSEPLFDYYNISVRPGMERIRMFLEKMFWQLS